jgi:competence protein ComEC
MFERRTDVYNSLGAAALIILIIDTRQLFDVGFQLSFAAVFSIVYFHPMLVRLIQHIPEKWEEIKAIDYIFKLFAVSLAAQLGTLPFTAYYFERVSIVSLFANIIVVPVIGLNVTVGFATLLFTPLSRFLAECFAHVNDLLVRFVLGFVKVAADVPMAFVDATGLGIPFALAYFLALFAVVHITNPRMLKRIFAVGLICVNVYLWHGIATEGNTGLQVTILDVGQGDAVLVQFPNGKAMLIDAGPRLSQYDAGERIVEPFLKRLGVTELDALVASHAHSDHIGGMLHVLETVKVSSFVEGHPAETALYRNIKQQIGMKKIRTDSVYSGLTLNLDPSTRLYVLHPPRLFASSNLNNSSVTMKLVYGKTSFLFVGDLEAEGESVTRARYGSFLDVDVLKVGHHGSSTSSTREFIAATSPSDAIISVGWKNKFRHPSATVLDRLKARGARVTRTDWDGGVVLKSDGEAIRYLYPMPTGDDEN